MSTVTEEQIEADIYLDIEPRPLQQAILENKSRKIVVIAHRRFGKTTLALLKIIENAGCPGTRHFYIAPTYRQAKIIAWQMLIDLIPPPMISKKNEVELLIRLTNGSVIELKGADNPDTLRGVGLNSVVIDEFAICDPSIWSEIIRPALADAQGSAIFIGTPKGKNHFFDLYENTAESDRYLLKASETNIIPKEELELAKQEMSADEYAQEFECGFLYFSGQIYKEFNHDIHVIKPFPIDDKFKIYASIDHGQVNPTAVIWAAVDYDDRIFIFDEHYEAGKTVQHHAKVILSKGYKMSSVPLLDPSAFAKNRSNGETLWSVADEYEQNGVPCLPAQNDVLGGINRVKEYFQNKKLFIFKNCEQTIKELDNYRWKDRKTAFANLPEEPLKMNDHLCDATRYMVLSRPHAPKWPKFVNPLEERRKELTKANRSKSSGDWYNL